MMKILEATEMPKVLKDFTPPIFKKFFNKRTLNYTLQHPSKFKIRRAESVFNGSESIAFFSV